VNGGHWHIPYHALYYPNPWPKQSEATRRFHLHPIFPTFLALGDTIELRTNWEIYAREFEAAVRMLAPEGTRIECIPAEPTNAETAFERKYKEARQQLWRVLVEK
jgi:tRNA G46 methylase TrmB